MVSGSRSSTASSSAGFRCLELRVRDAAAAERVAAEAFEAGALGLEERSGEGGVTLRIYTSEARAPELRRALAAACGDALELARDEPVVEEDWSEAWKEGLEPVVVAPGLAVRPPFRAPVAGVDAEVVIDPGQAFGTGGHASTRLALEWIEALSPILAGCRVLDAGCGSGVLALAALRLGAAAAVGFDLDPLAPAAARDNARANDLASGLRLFAGPLEALAPGAFDLVLANMLSSELLPLARGLSERTAPRGAAVFSGLLASEQDRVAEELAAVGLRCVARRSWRDANGDVWVALLTRH